MELLVTWLKGQKINNVFAFLFKMDTVFFFVYFYLVSFLFKLKIQIENALPFHLSIGQPAVVIFQLLN